MPTPWDASRYFYAFACKKKGLVLPTGQGEKVQMPESWKAATKEVVARCVCGGGGGGDRRGEKKGLVARWLGRGGGGGTRKGRGRDG